MSEERGKSECEPFIWNVDGSEFLENGLRVPVVFKNPVSGKEVSVCALLDTGSNRTGIGLSLANKFGLEEVCETMIEGFGGSAGHQLFKGVLLVPGISLETCGRFVGLTVKGLDSVIGRDVLGFCELSYDGSIGKAMLRRTVRGR